MHKYEKFRVWKCIDPWFQWSNKIEMAVVGKAFGLKSSNFFCNYND